MNPGELVRADNVDIDDRKRLRRRKGIEKVVSSTAITACWASRDESRLFFIENGTLKALVAVDHLVDIESGFSDAEAYFEDAGDRYFLACGDRLGYIDDINQWHDLAVNKPQEPNVGVTAGGLHAGRRLVAAVSEAADGRQGPACRVQSIDLTEGQGLYITGQAPAVGLTLLFVSRANDDQLRLVGDLNQGSYLLDDEAMISTITLDPVQLLASPPPMFNGPIMYREGRLYGVYNDREIAYLFRSEPFWTHLFSPTDTVEALPGKAVMLCGTNAGMVMGTDRAIYAITNEGIFNEVARYGAIPGQNAYYHPHMDRVFFWTQEGICTALPFENLTINRLSPKPGQRCFVGLVREGGFDRLVCGVMETAGDKGSNPR